MASSMELWVLRNDSNDFQEFKTELCYTDSCNLFSRFDLIKAWTTNDPTPWAMGDRQSRECGKTLATVCPRNTHQLKVTCSCKWIAEDYRYFLPRNASYKRSQEWLQQLSSVRQEVGKQLKYPRYAARKIPVLHINLSNAIISDIVSSGSRSAQGKNHCCDAGNYIIDLWNFDRLWFRQSAETCCGHNSGSASCQGSRLWNRRSRRLL